MPVLAVKASNKGLIKCSFLVLYTVRFSSLAAMTADEIDTENVEINNNDRIEIFLVNLLLQKSLNKL
jgi:hypothetical protein